MASEREKIDKAKMNSSVKHIPKDAQVIMSILKELNVTEYEPRVINQLLEFTYRYITCILDDAKIYANHAKKKIIDLDDVKLASQMTLEKSITSPPPREVLLELARAKNIAPLPLIKSHCGLRLPPERHCLLSANYKLRASDIQPKKMTKSALERTSGKVKAPGTTVLKRQTITTAPKTQAVTIPRPVIKFSANPNPKPIISATISTTSQSSSSSVISDKDAKETDLDKDKDKEEKDGEKVPQPSVGAASATAIVAGGSSGAPKDDQETKMDVDDEPKTGESKGLKRKHDDDDDLQVVE